MKNQPVVGIVAEYNPFHNGHSYQISQIKKKCGDAYIIVCMSGSFLQRGEAALADKWLRAEIAVKNGADLILELPAAYACRSSEIFAQGAVQTLCATGILTHLAFGCETNEPNVLAALAQKNFFSAELKTHLKAGLSYGAAWEKVLKCQSSKATNLLRKPNNILALAYYQALALLATPPLALPIQRKGNAFNSTEITDTLASATAIRQELLLNGFSTKVQKTVPKATSLLLKNLVSKRCLGISEERLNLILNYTLSKLTPATIARFADTSEGLENKILQSAPNESFEAAVNKIKSKRYPASRIRRLLWQLLISTEEVPFTTTSKLSPAYLRILAFNTRGRTILKVLKNTCTLPILNKLGKNIFIQYQSPNFSSLLKTDIAATNLYDLLQNNSYFNRDYTHSPIYIEF